MHDPAKWDLKADTANLPSIEQLKPVPVATDLKSGKTLLLDSSHVITSIIATAKLDLLSEIDIVHITGTSLEDVICDFEILNRP